MTYVLFALSLYLSIAVTVGMHTYHGSRRRTLGTAIVAGIGWLPALVLLSVFKILWSVRFK